MEALDPPRGLFVPPLPTLWPSMLWQGSAAVAFPPFSSPTARYFYLARNAIWLAVKMLRLDQAEVLVPAYHHGVEIEALIDAGARVRFYRVGSGWDVDLDDVQAKVGPATRALYLIHYAGFPGPVDAMRRLADERGLYLIEDCALSLLSTSGSRPLGTTGDVAIYCLYKTLPVPNGGALVVNRGRGYSVPEPPSPPAASTLSQLASSLLQNLELRGGAAGAWARNVVRGLAREGVRASGVERVPVGTQHFNRAHVDWGMSPWTRRIAMAQDMAAIIERRRRNYFYLLGALRGLSAPLFAELPPGVCPLFYPLRVPDKAGFMAELSARGIETVDFWSGFHPACSPEEFPEVAQLRRSVVELPCHQDLTPEVMAKVAAAARRALQPPRRS